MYAQIVLSKVNSFIDKQYTYKVPDEIFEETVVGKQVLVPFGNRRSIGYIVGLSEQAPENIANIKDLIEIRGDISLFDAITVETAKWMSERYISLFGTALHSMLPPGIKSLEKVTGRKRIAIDEEIGKTSMPAGKEKQTEGLPVHLSEAMRQIAEDLASGKDNTMLLTGPLGQEKGAFYAALVRKVIASGKGVIVLFPELYRSHPVAVRLYNEFKPAAAILHSAMTDKNKISEWERIHRGDAKLVIGTRNAVFAPVRDPGLVLIDQEEEFTYKQEQNPKYHAREAAIFLSKKRHFPVVLYSACPDVETYYKAVSGDLRHIEIPQTPGLANTKISIVDMRAKENGKSSLLSKELVREIGLCLDRKEKIILIMNRRGFSPYIMCSECGNPVQCPNCSVSLTYHNQDDRLRCHKCNFSCGVPVMCPTCKGTKIKFIGSGTQKLQSDVARNFPGIKILRIDRDSINDKGAKEIVMDLFAEGDVPVLIGTQMAAMAMEKAAVGLVALVSADTSLGSPDYRAAENTFRSAFDACALSKGFKQPGKLIVQTYNPDHYAFEYAKKLDYKGFYDKEIKSRNDSKYPPFSSIINVIIYGTDQKAACGDASQIAKELKNLKIKDVSVLGPAQTALAKVRGKTRWQILIKGPDLDIIKSSIREITDRIRNTSKKGSIRISIDVDPVS